MKQQVLFLLLFTLVALGLRIATTPSSLSLLPLSQTPSQNEHKNTKKTSPDHVSWQQITTWKRNNTPLLFIDARTVRQWEKQHIKGSFCLDLTQNPDDALFSIVSSTDLQPNTQIIFYCDNSGCQKSGAAKEFFLARLASILEAKQIQTWILDGGLISVPKSSQSREKATP